MDNRAIGIFDSGLGGLTSVKVANQILPNEKIIYFGDTGRVPYGTRSDNIIKEYALQDARFLCTHNIKALVIACGTVSSVAIDIIKNSCNIPIFSVVEPAAKAAVSVTANKKIGILGTSATIKSGAYEKILMSNMSDLKITKKACPLFVPLVENGYFYDDCTVAKLVAEEYLSDIINNKCDTVILGCTHYPILKNIISSVLPNDVNLIDSGRESIIALKQYLDENDMLSAISQENEFYVSDDTDNFSELAEIFLGHDIKSNVKKIDILKY